MLSKGKIPREKIGKESIITKMLSSTLFYTIIPLLVSGVLIIYTYQSLIVDLLTKKGPGLGEELLQEAKIQAFLTLFIVIVLTLFGNILVSRNLIRPLRKLLKGTNEVARGNLDFKIKVESKDEVGELSAQFNRMTQQLKEAKVNLEESKRALEVKVKERTKELEKTAKALEQSKTVLEIKVKARTQELENLTKNLEEQVQERTGEFQKKVEELERFQKFAVGREIKMVELKEELTKLQKN